MTRFVIQLSLLCTWGVATSAFLTPTSPSSSACASCTTTALWGRVKRGKLGKEIDVAASPVRRKTKKSSQKSGAASGSDANISPALAAYLATQTDDDNATTTAAPIGDVTPAVVETPQNKKKGGRKLKAGRVKQSARQAAEEANNELVEAWTKDFKELLEGKPSLDDLLGRVREVVDMPSSNFKQLSASADRLDFRLAWVGSDDAICHVGTGLHKVPLARLQEVFLSFCGRNRVEIQEVIRVLGPFPNVKNTLQGKSAFSRHDDAVEWRLTWDSMLDGTGKEIMAGKEENVQRVDLQVYFCSPSVVVAVVPPDTENVASRRTDPLENNGQHVLVFVKEDNLQEELEKLRVA